MESKGDTMKIYGEENNTFILQEIGQRIKDIRIARNMTQRELAEYAGVSFSTITRLEAGKGTTMDNLLRILRTFNLLANLELLVPQQKQTPEEIYHNKPKRKRVSKVREKATGFKWGDEEE